jgi:DNA-directed RNA polymerase subunit RPC12/RpoP
MLLYQCAHCKRMVNGGESPHWIDDGAMFFCPMCGGVTQFRLTPAQPDRAGSADGDDRTVDARQVSFDC